MICLWGSASLSDVLGVDVIDLQTLWGQVRVVCRSVDVIDLQSWVQQVSVDVIDSHKLGGDVTRRGVGWLLVPG